MKSIALNPYRGLAVFREEDAPFFFGRESFTAQLLQSVQHKPRRAIAEPAQTQDVAFEAGLVERILADVSDEPGHLPLLEFALDQLWQKQSQRSLTHAAYEEIGGVEGALSRYAEKEVFEKLNQADQERAHRVLVQLVHPGRTGRGYPPPGRPDRPGR